MSHFTCENARPLLPEWAGGELSARESAAVRAHLETCDDCSSEAETLRILRQARPEPSEGLAARIQDALRDDAERRPGPPAGGSDSRGGEASWWAPLQHPGLAAAAVIVLALGTALVWPQVGPGPVLPDRDSEIDAPLMVDVWASDDGIVAGAPVLEELSDEQLLALLQELEG